MTIKLFYSEIARVRDGRYQEYVLDLEVEFGGDGVELTEALADFCTEREWCLDGGSRVVCDILTARVSRTMVLFFDEIDMNENESLSGWMKRRWMRLFAFAERFMDAHAPQAAENAPEPAPITNGEAAAPPETVAPIPERPKKFITVAMLESIGACDAAIEKFQKVFGNEVEVTEENARKALKHRLDVKFLFHYLLGGECARALRLRVRDACPSIRDATADCTCEEEEALAFVRAYTAQA